MPPDSGEDFSDEDIRPGHIRISPASTPSVTKRERGEDNGPIWEDGMKQIHTRMLSHSFLDSQLASYRELRALERWSLDMIP